MLTLKDFKKYLKFSSEDFKAYQLKRLLPFVDHIRKNSKYYRHKLADCKKIKTYKDFANLPLLNQEDLRGRDIEEFRSILWQKIATGTRSSGSTGKSKIVLWSTDALEDEKNWGALGYFLQEVKKNSRLAILMPFDMSRIPAILDVCREIGTFTIPIGRIRTDIDLDNAIMYIRTFGATHLIGSPNRLDSIITRIEELRLDIHKDFKVTHLIGGGTSMSKSMRSSLEKRWNAAVFEEAGANELSFIAFECKMHDGLHLVPGLHYVEVVDANTLSPITKEGELGELVVTNFNNLATPLLRYRLGDLGYIKYAPCKCGLNFPRIFIKGRLGGTIAFGGTKIYAYQIENILSQFPKISMNYQVQIDKKKNIDTVHFIIESLLDDGQANGYKEEILQSLTTDPAIMFEINDKFQHGEITFTITFVKPGSLERSSGDKVKNQYLDKRKLSV